MNVAGIVFFSLGTLAIFFGIYTLTPLSSWAGKKFNKFNFSSVNYNQPNPRRKTSILIGICFFFFGLFITIASAAIIDIWKIPANQNPSPPQSVSPKSEIFAIPMVPAQNSTTDLNSEKNLSVPNTD